MITYFVFAGLFRMYKAEVLAKFPVIQHTLFGELVSIDPFVATAPVESKS